MYNKPFAVANCQRLVVTGRRNAKKRKDRKEHETAKMDSLFACSVPPRKKQDLSHVRKIVVRSKPRSLANCQRLVLLTGRRNAKNRKERKQP